MNDHCHRPGTRAGGTAGPPGAFDPALRGAPIRLVDSGGRELPADPGRWYATADDTDSWLLDRCTGPTLDLGCGPGRLVAALTDRGIPALGVDCSPRAARECSSRNAPMLRQDLFQSLPREGQWAHALLADGNIGIGGDPHALLSRAAALVAPGGSVLVESADPADVPAHPLPGPSRGGRAWSGWVRVVETGRAGARAADWVPWAVLDTASVLELAARLDLRVGDRHHSARHFVELIRAG